MPANLKELFRAHQNNQGDLKEAQKNTAKDLGTFIDQGKVDPKELSIREMFDVFVGESLREKGRDFDPRYSDFHEIQEEMVSSQFPFATGKLISPQVIEAYEIDTADLRSLFTESDSNRREEDIVGFSDVDRPRHVEEGQPYPEASMSEKRVKIRNHKFGQGIGLTVEMVRFDQTGELLSRARDSGQMIADLLEEFMAYRLSDTAFPEIGESTSQAFVYGGTRYALYSDDHTSVDGQINDNNISSGAAPNITQTRSMYNLLYNMKTVKGRPARIRPRVVFGHSQLRDQMVQFYELQDFDLDNTATASGQSGNRNQYKGALRVVTSQFFPSTTNWFIGDPARQFRMQFNWRPQVTVQNQGDPRRDIMSNFFVSTMVGIGATDYRYVVKNAGA